MRNPLSLRNLLTCVLLIVALWAGAFMPSNERLDLIDRADRAIASDHWDEAETALLTALGLEPDNPTNVMLLSNLGIVQYNLGRDSLAVQTLTRAHEIAPRSFTILSNRAQVLLAIGRDSLAMADYSELCQLDSTAIEPLYAHALLALRFYRPDLTEADCRRLDKLAPDSTETHMAWGALLSTRERWAEAVPHYTAILEREPSADVYAARAVAYLMLNRLGEAAADISRGLELDPDSRELYFYRAHLNKARYLPDDARADLLRALR